jgi:multidrug efflux pump subunit AcrA (membrane-fusion protein)
LLACGNVAPTPQVPTWVVQQQKFSRIVDADGYLKPSRTVAVAVPSDLRGSMRITWLEANGSVVKKGDPIARFDDLELRQRLADAEGDLATASAEKSKQEITHRASDVDRKRTIEGAQRELTLTRAFPRMDPLIFSHDEIIEQEIDGRLQEVKLECARKSAPLDHQLGARALGGADVEVKKAEDAIARAQKGLNSLMLAAPDAGVVTLARNGWTNEPLHVGDTVFRSMNVAEISMVEKMEAEVFVLEAEAAGLAEGRQAEVVLESQPGRPFAAQVKQVAAVAKRQSTSPTQYFGVVLTLAKTDPALMKSGQRVRARLFLHEQEALVIPRPSLVDRDGQWVVYRREPGGAFSAVAVKLGPSTAGLLTVESGLRAGDVIALRDPGKAADDLLPGASRQPARPH